MGLVWGTCLREEAPACCFLRKLCHSWHLKNGSLSRVKRVHRNRFPNIGSCTCVRPSVPEAGGQRVLVQSVCRGPDPGGTAHTRYNVAKIRKLLLTLIMCNSCFPSKWWCCLISKSCPTLVTPWTVTHQTLSMGFLRPRYWSVLPFPLPEGLPNPETEPQQAHSLLLSLLGSPP